MILHEFEERCYQRKENNPYHEKLKQFEHFVYLDHQAEAFKGQWRSQVFNNQLPLIVEIGVGYGDFMTNFCQNHPHYNYVGLDIRFKRSFNVAKKLESLNPKNFRFLRAQGQRLPHLFGPQEIDQLFCFFPDPWPKTKQFKKRLFQLQFLDQISHLLKKDGLVLFKTDHLEYFDWILKQLAQCSSLKTVWKSYDLYADYQQLQDEKIKNQLLYLVTFQTKFEKIFLQQNKPIKAIILCPQR